MLLIDDVDDREFLSNAVEASGESPRWRLHDERYLVEWSVVVVEQCYERLFVSRKLFYGLKHKVCHSLAGIAQCLLDGSFVDTAD